MSSVRTVCRKGDWYNAVEQKGEKMNDLISRKLIMQCIDEGWIRFDTEKDKNRIVHLIRDIAPSVQPEWNNHTVACMLAELFDDDCACNYNGIDEWLPNKCELLDACSNPVGVACWEQYLKHRAERRTDEQTV